MTTRTALLALAVLPAAAFAAGCGDHAAAAPKRSSPSLSLSASSPAGVTSSPAPSTTAPAGVSSPASTHPPTTAAPVAPTGPCRTSQLVFALGAHATSAGRTTYALTMRNTAAAPCTVSGYPAVDLLETGGMQAGPAAADLAGDAPGGTAATVLLRSGQSARSNFSYVAAADGGTDCDPAPVAALLVFAPGQTTSTRVPFATSACTDAADRAGVTTVVAAS